MTTAHRPEWPTDLHREAAHHFRRLAAAAADDHYQLLAEVHAVLAGGMPAAGDADSAAGSATDDRAGPNARSSAVAPVPPASRVGRSSAPLVYESRQLLADRDEVLIHHDGVAYRLRRTRQDKLILTK